MKLIVGNCVEVLARGTADRVDAIVTDPPYGLEFMGKEWDKLSPGSDVRQPFRGEVQTPDNPYGRTPVRYPYGVNSSLMQQWHYAWAVEALRVLKPGGHLLAFGGTRTYHRLACALEDAGFEIRDTIAWMYGSGFPKSHDVSKAIDKAAGAERDAERWQGWGTALKPAHEPIVVARKPLAERTVAAQVLATGTGALNIDGTRIETDETYSYPNGPGGNTFSVAGNPDGSRTKLAMSHPAGRWPANVALDEEAAAMLDEQSRGKVGKPRGSKESGEGWGMTKTGAEYADTGGASRFYYVAKASRKERNAGLEHPNDHPTVKPVALMRWLCRMVTPPGGIVLDPFAGSGTTGVAAVLEGFEFVGVEQDAHYCEIARARIEAAQKEGQA